MTQEKQIDLLEQFHKDKMETLISKGKDYASKDDILSNFKNSGAIVGVSKERQILSLIATKVARLGNLLDNKDKPNNESIEDTVKDLSGYIDLMYCAFKENQKDIIVDLMNDSTQYDYDKLANKPHSKFPEKEYESNENLLKEYFGKKSEYAFIATDKFNTDSDAFIYLAENNPDFKSSKKEPKFTGILSQLKENIITQYNKITTK